MGKIQLTGKRVPNDKLINYDEATIELESPALSTLKEGDEVLVKHKIIIKERYGHLVDDTGRYVVSQSIVAILSKGEEQPKEMPVYWKDLKGNNGLLTIMNDGFQIKDLQDRIKKLEANETNSI